jgi:ubiquinone/menaquinone biosynthesis C-methylase UbiE
LLLAGVDVVVADMLDLPFEQESFDLVMEKGTMVRNVHELIPSCVFTSLTK